MARGRKAGKANEHNEDIEATRQEAREASSNVAQLTHSEETRAQQLRDVTTEFNRLKAEGQRINAERKAQLERVDALGLDRNEFRALVKLLEVDDEKRTRKARTRREFLRAHNLPEQTDMFEPKAQEPGSLPGVDRAFIGGDAPQHDAATTAAIGKGFITQAEIDRNREAFIICKTCGQLNDNNGAEMLKCVDCGTVMYAGAEMVGLPVLDDDDLMRFEAMSVAEGVDNGASGDDQGEFEVDGEADIDGDLMERAGVAMIAGDDE